MYYEFKKCNTSLLRTFWR